ncbi:hypothetical protein QJQ45_008715 [Haematococcus lacustris]|nr:hypothetical protein QJQ45_008715 [Haematococcus lacustris]
MTEAQLQQACEEVLEAALLDLEEKHKHLQASHRQQRLDNESLEAVVKQQELAMTTAKRAHHRLKDQLRKYQRRPQLTRKQRQQLQILKQTGVSIEVLRRWADSNCSRLDTHGRPDGLTALGAGIKAAIEDIASLLAQHWGELSLARSGAKPETPCDTRWASYTTAAASVIRVWRLAGEAVARVVEGQRERSPPWAVTLSGYFKDTDLLLKICVVAVVGSSLLQPELLWASQHDGLHAFELYRHTQAVQTSLSQTWTNSSQLLSDMQGQLQHLVPAQQRQQQEHQLLTYLQVHCQAMSSYYEQHVRIQNALPGLFAALGSSDPATRWEAAQEVVSHAERMQQQRGQRLPMCDPRVWNAHGTWQKHEEQIRAMADDHELSEQDQQELQVHLELCFSSCPCVPTSMPIDGVDVLDFAQRLPELRKEVRREEAAAAMARRIAKAEMKAAAATLRVGQVVVDVGDYEGQHRLSAAYALTYDGRDYSHTTVEEAHKPSVRELRFHQQEVMKGWLKPKLKGLVMAHICNTVAALHGDELGAATGAGPALAASIQLSDASPPGQLPGEPPPGQLPGALPPGQQQRQQQRQQPPGSGSSRAAAAAAGQQHQQQGSSSSRAAAAAAGQQQPGSISSSRAASAAVGQQQQPGSNSCLAATAGQQQQPGSNSRAAAAARQQQQGSSSSRAATAGQQQQPGSNSRAAAAARQQQQGSSSSPAAAAIAGQERQQPGSSRTAFVAAKQQQQGSSSSSSSRAAAAAAAGR